MASLWTKFTDIFSRNKSGVVPQAPSGTGTSKYLREDGTWASIKLVYKQDAIPQNEDDGTVVTLNSSDTQKTVTNVNGLNYFVIFMSNANYAIESNVDVFNGEPATTTTLFEYDAQRGNSDTVSGKTFGGAFAFNAVDGYYEVGRNSAYIPYPQSHTGYSVTLGSGIITAKMRLYIDSSQLGTATDFASLIFTTENNDYLSFGISRQGGTTYVDKFTMMLSQYNIISARGEDDILFPRDQWFDVKFVVTYETDGTIPHIDFYVDEVKVAEYESEYTYGPDPSTVYTQLQLASDSRRASYSTRKVVKFKSVEISVEVD